jgi:hypothetical protein
VGGPQIGGASGANSVAVSLRRTAADENSSASVSLILPSAISLPFPGQGLDSDDFGYTATMVTLLSNASRTKTSVCRCGHIAATHSHFRSGADCGLCDCERLRKTRRNKAPVAATTPWPRDLIAICAI